jgi:hypothetical protein
MTKYYIEIDLEKDCCDECPLMHVNSSDEYFCGRMPDGSNALSILTCDSPFAADYIRTGINIETERPVWCPLKSRNQFSLLWLYAGWL